MRFVGHQKKRRNPICQRGSGRKPRVASDCKKRTTLPTISEDPDDRTETEKFTDDDLTETKAGDAKEENARLCPRARRKVRLQHRKPYSSNNAVLSCLVLVYYSLPHIWTLLRSDCWIVVKQQQGEVCQRLNWWKTELARSVFFCLLFPIIGLCKSYLLFPLLLFSGFFGTGKKIFYPA